MLEGLIRFLTSNGNERGKTSVLRTKKHHRRFEGEKELAKAVIIGINIASELIENGLSMKKYRASTVEGIIDALSCLKNDNDDGNDLQLHQVKHSSKNLPFKGRKSFLISNMK